MSGDPTSLGRADLGSELRPVTALFADVVGSTSLAESMDPEEWSSLITNVVQTMSAAVARQEGTVSQITGDGILALFGAPVAHEDDPERAIEAGLEMVRDGRRLADHLRTSGGLEFDIRVGINSGPVMVGMVGSEQARGYTALGDAVNVASRIQAEAWPGSVLITEATHALARGRFEFSEVGSISLKGKAEPIRAFEVIGTRATPLSTRGLAGLGAPLIGRAGNLSELLGAMEAVRAGSGRAVFLIGEPGIGKTRLLEEFRASAADQPVVWATGRCVSGGRNLPYHLVLDSLRSMLVLPPLAEEAATKLRSRLRHLLPEGSEEANGWLGHLLSLPLGAETMQQIESFQPPARHERYLESIRRLIRALAARGPLVLVFEDLHWSDPSSIEVLRDLVTWLRDAGSVLLALSSRPDPDSPVWRLLETARVNLGSELVDLRLEPLGERDSKVLLTTLLEIESLPPALRSMILGKAEGNPFFLEEVIRMLIDHGAISRAGDTWQATGRAPDVSVPETLHGLLLARIDSLPAEARQAVRVAAVIGRKFTAEVLARVMQVDAMPALERLETTGLVGPVDGGYEFRHALIQEAAYESVLKRDRRMLHGRVAEILVSLHAEGRSELAVELAHHLELAGEIERAVGYLLEAGEHALARFAAREAWELFIRAESHLNTAVDDPEGMRQLLLARLGRVRAGFTFIPFPEALTLVEHALPLAERAGDHRLEAEAHLWIVRLRDTQGETPETSPALKRSLDRAREIADELSDDWLRAFPVAAEGSAAYSASKFRHASATLAEAVSLLDDSGEFRDAAYHAGIAAISHARLGEFEEAESWVARAYGLAERSGDANARLDADIHAGMVASERGDLRRSTALLNRGIEMAEQVDNKYCQVVGHFVLGDNALRAGEVDQAVVFLERSSDVARFCQAVGVTNLSRAWLGRARAMLGQGTGSLDDLEESLAQVRMTEDRLGEGRVLSHRALVRAALPAQDWDLISGDFEAALAVFRELEARPYEARTLRDYALSAEASGYVREARDKKAQAAMIYKELGMKWPEEVRSETERNGDAG